MRHRMITIAGLFLLTAGLSLAVNSVMTRHQTGSDFLKGKPENIVIDSNGTLRLARQSEVVDVNGLNTAWSVHTILSDAQGVVYLGTGPDAGVFRVDGTDAVQVYPPAADPNVSETAMRNEHVFALAQDGRGRLLAAVSGKQGRLVRVGPTPETLFEDKRVEYIFAMAVAADGAIFLGTGPEGLLFKLDSEGKNPQVVFDAKDKSLLSLAVKDGFVYAGGDQRGLIYKIDPNTSRAAVLYDSDQDEISSLLLDAQGNVYAAATTAGAAMLQLQMPAPMLRKAPGRPDTNMGGGTSGKTMSINTANTDEEKEEKQDKEEKKETSVLQAPPPPPAKAAGHIYKINPEGFVTDVFSEMAVLYTLTEAEGGLWLGTGNKGQLFTVDPLTEEAAMLYENKTSSQVTAVRHVGPTAYIGLSNPAQLVRMEKQLKRQGVYESAFVDAGQPARWGKLQIEADIPDGSRILMACRSGNVSDPNDQTLSAWSDEVELRKAADLACPPGRYLQYRLKLIAAPDGQGPVVRQAAAAHVVPNLAPLAAAVRVERSRDKKTLNIFEISYAVADDNKDTLVYKLEFRKAGNTVWIPLKDELDQPRFGWDSRTVEDGRYEVRVTANDYKSNTTETALTGSRISETFVIDNTAPKMQEPVIAVKDQTVRMNLTVQDAWSVLGKVQYTVDSSDKWITALPEDMVYDTLTEQFVIEIRDLKPGRHVVAVMAADDVENAGYQSWEVDVP